MARTHGRSSVAPLLELEPELGRFLDADAREAATRAVAVRVLEVDDAETLRDPPDDEGRPFGLLVVEGALVREVTVEGRPSAQLLGPGDLATPWAGGDGLVAAETAWWTAGRLRVAVLNDRVLLGVRRWPRIVQALAELTGAQFERLAVQQAVVTLPRVEQRLLALMWALSERWGHVSPAGVELPLRLTHDLLGRLVGARRPTVTLALGALAERQALRRNPDGTWLVLEAAPTPAIARRPSVRPSAPIAQPHADGHGRPLAAAG